MKRRYVMVIALVAAGGLMSYLVLRERSSLKAKAERWEQHCRDVRGRFIVREHNLRSPLDEKSRHYAAEHVIEDRDRDDVPECIGDPTYRLPEISRCEDYDSACRADVAHQIIEALDRASP